MWVAARSPRSGQRWRQNSLQNYIRSRDETTGEYIWEQRDRNCFVCIGQAEINRPRRGQPWVVMIPRAVGDKSDQFSWSLLSEGAKAKNFPNAKEAMAAAECYLSVFHQYHQPPTGERLDLADGNGRVAGGQKPDTQRGGFKSVR